MKKAGAGSDAIVKTHIKTLNDAIIESNKAVNTLAARVSALEKELEAAKVAQVKARENPGRHPAKDQEPAAVRRHPAGPSPPPPAEGWPAALSSSSFPHPPFPHPPGGIPILVNFRRARESTGS